ncbi:pentapeptide repeat-containing protein [Myceligenerans sp. I2]|uniref:Pentapeptide repeat-containing protein n=2 Tax=Myceligenerans indicum TaxID=2593663 RepID=A0ABS1LGF4_9MICO|nr:pentapeptide repeat-containing protein [Myceligenerans indicum]
MNLRGANLSGFDLGCDVEVEHNSPSGSGQEADGGDASQVGLVVADAATCSDLSGADLTGAVLNGTDLTGSRLDGVRFAPSSAAGVRLVGAWVSGRFDVEFGNADLRAAQFVYDDEPGGTATRISVHDSRMDALRVGVSGSVEGDVYAPFEVIRSEALQTHWAPGTAACASEMLTDDEPTCLGAEKAEETHFPLTEQKKFYAALDCPTTRDHDALVTTCYAFESRFDE